MTRSVSIVALALSMVLGATAPALAESAKPRPAATRVVEAQPATASAVTDDATRYAEREKPAQEQKDYQGGDYVVIGISTGALIVALIIVLILL